MNQKQAPSSSVRMALFSVSGLLKQYLKSTDLVFQLLLTSLIIQVFSLGFPIFYLIIFDRVFGRQNLATLDVMGIGLMMVLAFDLIIKLLRSPMLDSLFKKIDQLTVQQFLQWVSNQPLRQLNPANNRLFSEQFSRLMDVNRIIGTLFFVSSLDAAFSLLVVAILLLMDIQLAVIALAPLIPMAIILFGATPRIKQRHLNFEKEKRQSAVKLLESLDNAEMVKTLNVSSPLNQKITMAFNEALDQSFGARFDKINIRNIQQTLMLCGNMALLYVGALKVLSGDITFGVYLAISMLARHVLGVINKLFESFLEYQQILPILEQIQAHSPVISKGQKGIILDSVKGDIQLVNVHFQYSQTLPKVLKGVNLTIQPGEKIVITGKSGAGKTTLLRLLQKLYDPTDGHILLDGYNLAECDAGVLSDHIGLVLQRPFLFSGTIRDNIALGKTDTPLKEISDAASLAQMDDFLLQTPEGFDTHIMAQGANLSSGQAARIALARAFLRNPSVLMLDEITAHLEPAMQSALFNRIGAKYRDKTCLFVSDFVPLHQMADKIVVLNEGKIAEMGKFEDLIQAKGYYYYLYKPESAVLSP